MYKLLVLATLFSGALADHDSKHQEELPSACRMSPDTSDCGGSEQRWFYYADLKMCTEFTYKGCGKTENNFATRDDCEKLCLEKTETESTKTSEASEQSQIPEESVNKETEQSDNAKPDVPKTEETALENVEESDEDAEEIEEKLKEQEEIQQRFNMANSNDLLTLEEYMQDENIDMADILEAAEAGDITDEDIKANLYTGDESEYGEEEEEDHETETDKLPTKTETDKLPTKSETDELPTESETLKEDDGVANGQNDEASDETYMQQQLEEEGELQERFNMANSEDMLALQGIIQDPGMEVGDVEEQNNDEGQAEGDVSPPENEGNEDTLELDIEGDLSSDYTDGFPSKITIGIDTSDLQQQQPEDFQPNLYYSNSNTDDEDEDVVDATQRRQQFAMADSDDYVTLEDLMSNPNMEIIESENRYAPNDAMEISQIRYDDNQEMNSENEKVGPFKEGKQDLQDTYGEHLDYNHPEISKDEEEAEIDDAINFETELEQKFNMADREDILSLEEILQDPNNEVAEVVHSENAGNTQDSDVKGVLSLAASFLGDNSNEEKDQLKELENNMQHLPYIARKPFEEAAEDIHRDLNDNGVTGNGKQNIDYTHPAELLKRQQIKEEKQLVTPPINIQSMAHDDKMMLMSLLHVDRLKFHRLAQTTPSLLDLVKEEREKKLLHNDVSPNEGFIDMISRKDGIKKCCLLHKDPGPCQDKTLQWHYDPVLHTCLPFFYGGCEGNKNRFDTIGECLRKCGFNDQEKRKSSPEPIPEPPTFSKDLSSRNGFKAVISKILPGKMLSLRDRMTPGQQKFIHKFIKSAINHVSDIKPVKIGQIPLAFGKYKLPENMVDRRNRLPMPIKSILFKWPILRMVFDRTIKDIKPMRDMQEMSEPMDNILPMFPREFKEYRRLDQEWDKGSRGDFKDFRKMGRDRSEFRNYKKLDRGNRENREEFGDSKKMGRFWGRDRNNDEPKGRRSRHFSPSFKKSYKMMNLNEDKRHQISADPKNKVNLIQVFVNKPHTESHSNPSHHHTMIKKEYSPVMEPQVEPPMPPAPAPPPPVSSHLPAQAYPGAYPRQYYNRPPLPHHQQQLLPPSSYPYPPPPQVHGAFSPKPFIPQINTFPHPHTHSFPHPPPPPHHFHSHGHQHHHHPNQMAQHPQYHVHEHMHPLPMMPHYGPPLPPPPFNVQPIKPWWARFGKPYFEPPQFEHGSMRDGRHPDVIVQSTKYPEQEEEVEEEHPVEEDTEEVVMVDEADADEGLHYSCLLPVSTGVCKAYEERYYFNKATVSCELFIYGGCGGNANNYASKRECEATCSDTVLVDTESRETSTLPDDTIIITSPVYVPAEAANTDNTETTPASVREEDRKEGKDLSDGVIVEEKEEEKTETQPDVKVEPVKLFHSSNTEYIIIITVMCFVGLSAVVLVALAIANLSRRLSKTKKEKVIEAVLSSHLDARSYGSVTPNRMSYYGHHSPSELGPPPISEVLKVHKDKEADEEM